MDSLGFSSAFFRHNRRQLQAKIGEDTPIAVTANGLIQRGADSTYPFAQDANFWYLSGINDPDVTLVIDGEREFLIAPLREGSRIVFEGQIDSKKLSSVSGVEDVVNEAAGWKRLDSILARSGKVATLSPAAAYIEQYGMYSNPARARFIDRLHKHSGDIELVDIRHTLAQLRMIKQPPELAAIKKAINITTTTLKEVISKPYGTYEYEYQIEADISRGFRFLGSEGHAFEPIVSGGERACILHNFAAANKLKVPELVVMDVGASYCGYAADITRTIATGIPTKRQKEIYLAVKEAQEYAYSLLKPGVHLRGYESGVAKFIGNKLKELGITSNIKMETIRKYFPHATSHFLGLNVHDVGDYQKPLAAGVVITVEPGIYVPEEGIGVRLEDDVLITDSGIEILSRSLPTRL